MRMTICVLRDLCGGLALCCLVAACAQLSTSKSSRVDIAPDVVLVLPAAPPFGSRGTAVQLVEARYGDRTAVLQAFVESDDSRTIVVMTIPSGPRIMSVEWTREDFKTRLEPQAPPGLTGEHMLADMMLIYAPLAVLQASVSGAQVTEDADGGRRVTQQGQALIEIVRPAGSANANPWNGQASLQNLAYGYSLAITSQSSIP